MIFPVILTVYADKTFDYVLKTPPAAVLLKQAAKIEKGSARPHRDKVATIKRGSSRGNCKYKNERS